MKKTHAFRILSFLLMVFVALAVVTPAYADTHVQNVYVNDYNFTLIVGDPVDPSPCNFDIQVHGYGNFRVNLWLDEYNRQTKEVDIYGNLKEDWSANGKAVNIQFQGPILYRAEYYSDKNVVTARTVGAYVIATVPHYGIIRGGGGQILETYTFTPDWSTILFYNLDKQVGNITWDWGPLCTYLGP